MKKPLIQLLSTVLFIACSLLAIPTMFQLYFSVAEIHDFSYSALGDNLARYPEDIELKRRIASAMSDGEITGTEHRDIMDYLMDKNGIYIGAKMDEDHSHGKGRLSEILEKAERNS